MTDRGPIWQRLWALGAAAALWLVGCSGAELEKTVASVKGSVNNTVAAVSERVSGTIELRLSPPIKLEECHATFTPGAGLRPAVLQMASYPELKLEKYPSVFLFAESNEVVASTLSGKTLAGQLFVQHQSGGPIWHSRREEPLKLIITESSGQYVVCSVAASKLYNTKTGESTVVSGKITGRLK